MPFFADKAIYYFTLPRCRNSAAGFGLLLIMVKNVGNNPRKGGCHMFPEAFLKRMEQMLGGEYGNFLSALEQEPYQALRLNSLKKDADGQSAAKVLTQNTFAHLTPVSWAENGYYYAPDDQPGRHPYHEAGLYYIQEPSAMSPVELLGVRPGEKVLDLCAAPGGKSTQIAAKLQGKGILLCNEIHPARAKVLSENVERMGICNALATNETPRHLAEIFPGYFDRILADAPCSGEGMFRKNKAACGEWSQENVELCAERQDEILDCAAAMLRPGGRLVYSTCTFAPKENEGSISRFLNRHRDFSIVPVDKAGFGLSLCDGVPEWGNGEAGLKHTLRLWPHRVRGEGHFAAVMQKAGSVTEGYSSGLQNGTVRGVPEKELKEFSGFCIETIRMTGSSPIEELGELLGIAGKFTAGELAYIRFGSNLYLAPGQMPDPRGLKILRCGLHLGELKKNRFEPSHALALALCPGNVRNVWNLKTVREANDYLNGQTFPAQGEKGWYLVCLDGFSLGWGKLAGGIMKNHYPKGLRINC